MNKFRNCDEFCKNFNTLMERDLLIYYKNQVVNGMDIIYNYFYFSKMFPKSQYCSYYDRNPVKMLHE